MEHDLLKGLMEKIENAERLDPELEEDRKSVV